MTRTSSILAAGVVSIISLITFAGCSKAPEALTVHAPSTSDSSNTTESTANGFDGLKTVIMKTRHAVEAGDFATASSEFGHFEPYWKQIEDGIKDSQPDTYDAIESSMDEIRGELNAPQPNQEQLLATIQSLETNVNAAAN